MNHKNKNTLGQEKSKVLIISGGNCDHNELITERNTTGKLVITNYTFF